ncbi:hypothetical protein [Longimicrobium sp.]|uniref:hypothetical protein n=1 Tax=Longimicrobium sp. TaxID=2029185 RepID=UPI003B3B548F
MQHSIPRTRSVRRVSAAALIVLAACGGGDAAEETQAARVEEVDQTTSPTATERELASFQAPRDSVLTPQQVQAFLRVTLLQYDLIRTESRQYHERATQMAQRAEKGGDGLVAGLRNAVDAGGLVVGFTDLVGGSYVRAARSQGQNPAEMEWVRERMGEVAGFLAMRPMLEASVTSAQAIRQQAEQYRGQPGFDDATVDEMLKNAEESERQAREQLRGGTGAVARNLEVLHRARPNVTDHMWTAVAFASGGLLGLTGLSDPDDTTAQRQLNEWRQVYTDALANRVTAGMEADKKPGEARPQLGAAAPAN